MAYAFDYWKNSDFRVCPVCNEKFYIPPYVTEWGYKIRMNKRVRAVCSYSCLNKAKRRIAK